VCPFFISHFPLSCTHSDVKHMCHVAHMNATRHTYQCDMWHIWMSHITHVNATHMNESCHTYECDTSHIPMRHVTHMKESWHDSSMWPISVVHDRLLSSVHEYSMRASRLMQCDSSMWLVSIVHDRLLSAVQDYFMLAHTFEYYTRRLFIHMTRMSRVTIDFSELCWINLCAHIDEWVVKSNESWLNRKKSIVHNDMKSHVNVWLVFLIVRAKTRRLFMHRHADYSWKRRLCRLCMDTQTTAQTRRLFMDTQTVSCTSWRSSSWLDYMCHMSHSYVSHDLSICVTWLIHMCDMTHSYVWHDSFICVTWLIHMCDMTHSYVWHVSFMCVTWLIHLCDATHSHVWHDSFICVTWLIHMWHMTHSYVRHDSFICVTWLIHMCDMTHSYMPHDSFIWLIHMCDMTYPHVSHDSFTCVKWHDSWVCATWHIQMSHTHITHAHSAEISFVEWRQKKQSCFTYTWVMSHIPSSEWVMSHTWMSHVTQMNESCHTHEWWMSAVTHMNESCDTYQGVMSHTWMRHAAWHHTYQRVMLGQPHEWVMSHTWMSHVTHMNESCHT